MSFPYVFCQKLIFPFLYLSGAMFLPKWKFFFEFIIYHVHWMLIFRFACKKFSRMMLLLFSEFFLRFPTSYRHFYDMVNFIFGASRWRTLIFVLLLTSGVTILYSTISAHLFCVNSFLSFSQILYVTSIISYISILFNRYILFSFILFYSFNFFDEKYIFFTFIIFYLLFIYYL